jgi:hypothetical protein
MVQRVIQVNEKNLFLQHRFDQAKERADGFEDSHDENPDLTSNKYAGLYGKGLIHDATTKLPEENEITKLKFALSFGDQSYFDALTRGGTRKLTDPQASLSYEMSGGGPTCDTIPASPDLHSGQAAAEMMEVYEKALLRDVPFYEIEGFVGGSVGKISRAINTLRSYGTSFKGPKVSNQVTHTTLFRGVADGCLIGPYVSQLLLRDVPLGAHTVVQKYNYEQGVYGITENNWFEIQKGNVPVAQLTPLEETKHIYNGRSLASFVHVDFVYQVYYYALAILLGAGVRTNPGFSLTNEEGFCAFGGPAEIATGMAEVARHALRSAWVQKWRHNLRLRPEAMAHRIYAQELNGSLNYVDSTVYSGGSSTITAVKTYNAANGGENKALLPLQYAEGSPTHPSYPAGHAVLSGACATYLKLMLEDTMLWTQLNGINTVVESLDGDSLSTYPGTITGMTVGTELNKLASNISIGRNIAGVHYRADGDEGMKLGEKIAINYVKDQISTYNVTPPTLSLKKFDGTTITI